MRGKKEVTDHDDDSYDDDDDDIEKANGIVSCKHISWHSKHCSDY